jgi:hypothetical protein
VNINIPISTKQAYALVDILHHARTVVLLDGTDRLSLDQLRKAVAAYDLVVKETYEA